jgi:DNA-binding transcriptional LysR family regulator
MLHEHQLLKQELHAGANTPTGTLRVGVVPTAVAVAARFAAALQAAYPTIAIVLRSLSSHEIETGLVDLTLDLGLGFTERVSTKTGRIESVMQYEDRHFLLQHLPGGSGVEIGRPCGWKDAALMRLCLLAPEMHNRQIVERAFRQAGVQVTPVIETNSVLALMLCVAAGEVSGVVPGSLVASTPAGAGFMARPLIQPKVVTSVGLLVLAESARSRTLQIAVDFARSTSCQTELGSGVAGWNRFKA